MHLKQLIIYLFDIYTTGLEWIYKSKIDSDWLI